MKTSKKILVLALPLVLLVMLSACSMLSDAAKLQNYDFGNESVPSINSVVGEREVTSASTSSGTDGQIQEYTYKSDDVPSDLVAYIDKLQSLNWVSTETSGDDTAGFVQFGIESVDAGKIILVSITYDSSSYTIKIQKTEGTLTRY
jgi:hypothetical protein